MVRSQFGKRKRGMFPRAPASRPETSKPMTTRNLDKLFAPKSVAVIGASNRPAKVGNVVMRNLLQGLRRSDHSDQSPAWRRSGYSPIRISKACP